MKFFEIKVSFKKLISKIVLIGFGGLFISTTSFTQVRTYSLIYSDNIKGGTAMFGNTLLNIVDNNNINLKKMNDNSATGYSIYGNDNENMQYVDIDGNTGNGSVTRNSSSSDLVLPAGTNTIKLARLYWGGRLKTSDFDLNLDSNKNIKIRKGTTSAYSDVRALAIDKFILSTGFLQYQAYADITAFVKNNGAGTYEVGNAPLTTGHTTAGGNHGGWCIVVVYENTAMSYNSIRLYDGFAEVYSNNNNLLSTTVTLTGLNVPSGELAEGDAQMGVLAWEGDANLKKDYLKINSNLFSNATNPSDNPWNGTISSNGVHVTTKNPNYTNQMGIDIDQFDVGKNYGILPNANSVTLEFGTESDQYFPGLFTFTIKMKDPTITLEKTVKDANNNHLGEANEVLTYILKGENNGAGNANSIVLVDTLPSTVTYVPNSLNVITCPGVECGTQTDAAGDDIAEYIENGSIKTVRFKLGRGATNAAGGSLASTETYEVQFKVTVNDPGFGKHVPSILNIARIKAQSDASVNFVDDGTAIINPDFGPLPVTMVSFTAKLIQGDKVKIDWSTSMEINCSKYKIERSFDGNFFSEAGEKTGNGTTSLFHSYSFTDDVSLPPGPIAYYRIKQLDLDDKASYSKIISVKIKKTAALNISPNPFTSYLNINTEWNTNEVVNIKVINIQGKEIISKNIKVNKGFNHISINDLSKLPPGNYIIQLLSGTQRFSQKITKQ